MTLHGTQQSAGAHVVEAAWKIMKIKAPQEAPAAGTTNVPLSGQTGRGADNNPQPRPAPVEAPGTQADLLVSG